MIYLFLPVNDDPLGYPESSRENAFLVVTLNVKGEESLGVALQTQFQLTGEPRVAIPNQDAKNWRTLERKKNHEEKEEIRALYN